MDRQEGGGIFFQEGSNGLKNQNINKFRPCVCVWVHNDLESIPVGLTIKKVKKQTKNVKFFKK